MKIIFILFMFMTSIPAWADFQNGSGFNSGDLNMQKYSVQFHEADANPSNPPEQEIKLFSKNSGGVTLLYFVESNGDVHLLNHTLVEFGSSGSTGGLTFLGQDLTFLGQTVTFTP